MSERRKPLAAVNVTPLVDVLLILLVVVMLAMPLFVKRLSVDLPKTSASAAPVAVKSLSVAILPNGTLAMNDSPASEEAVLAAITPQTSVEVSIDKSVQYEAIAKVLARLQEKGPKDVALMTR